MRQKYPHSTFFFRCLNFIFRNLLKDQAFYYSGILLKKDLSCDLPLLETNGYKFMQADVNDIRSICEHPESPDFEVYKDRLLRNHVCYCAKDNNEVMCYVWLCFDTCGLFFGTDKEVQFLPLASNQVYSYNLYTFNNHRHKGIASQLHNYCNISLKSKGITERLVIIGPSFIGSMKISLRNGFMPQRMIYVYEIQKLKKVFLGNEKHFNKLDQWIKWFEATHGIQKISNC